MKAIADRPCVLSLSQLGVVASNRIAAIGVSPDFKAVVADAVQLRYIVAGVEAARRDDLPIAEVDGIDPEVAAAVDLSDASPTAIARFCGRMDRLDVAGEVKTVCGETTVPAARARFDKGRTMAAELDASSSGRASWHYDAVEATFRCTFGDDLFRTVVPAAHRVQLAHAVVVMGCDASMYVVATTKGTMYSVLVTRGTDPRNPTDFSRCAACSGSCTCAWGRIASQNGYARADNGQRHVHNGYLSAHYKAMADVVDFMGLNSLFTGIVGGTPGRLETTCPPMSANVPLELRLAFMSHWRLTMSVRLVAMNTGPLPVCKRFKT